MASWARPGVKCVYIGPTRRPNPLWRGVAKPVAGQVYTVRDVLVSNKGVTVIWLVEISNPLVYVRDMARQVEWGFNAAGFRPLVTQSDDVAKFTHLLNPAKLPERV